MQTQNKIDRTSGKPTRSLSALLILASLASSEAMAENERKITWGGFIDTQWAYDFNSPPNGDRAFTTQPARSNEFSINLAFIDVKIDSPRTRGRLALQAGTSVQSNYSSEPKNGTVSGGDLSRHIQEARIGYAIGDRTWVDAGIFFAHVGAESWISKENLTLMAFNIWGIIVVFLLQIAQQALPLNPQNLSGVSWHSALNTAISFVTNTFPNAARSGKQVY